MQAMVLNDGETFTGLIGCQIIEVPDHWSTTEDIEAALAGDDEAVNLDDLKVIQTF
jgi:hypothetical protein